MRRIIHPDPRDQAQAASKPLGTTLTMLDNSNLKLEYYEFQSEAKPVWEGPDAIPVPVIQVKPLQQVVLNAKEEPIPYEKQVRFMNRYKELLRRIDRELGRQIQARRLDRNVQIEKIIDISY